MSNDSTSHNDSRPQEQRFSGILYNMVLWGGCDTNIAQYFCPNSLCRDVQSGESFGLRLKQHEMDLICWIKVYFYEFELKR